MNSSLGLWRRFVAVFSPTFLSKLNKESSHGRSWGFWFLSNFFLALIPVIIAGIMGFQFLSDFPHKALERIPEDRVLILENGDQYNVRDLIQNFEIKLQADFTMETKNIPNPFVMSVDQTGKEVFFGTDLEGIDITKSNFVLFLNTEETDILVENFSQYQSGLFFLRDTFVSKEANGALKVLPLREMLEQAHAENPEMEMQGNFPMTFNFDTLTKLTPLFQQTLLILLSFLLGITYLIIAVFRLIPILFWTLIFWGIGEMVKIPSWNFEKSFMGMLHLSFVPMLFWPLQLLLDTWLLCPLVLVLLVSANFWEMKRKA